MIGNRRPVGSFGLFALTLGMLAIPCLSASAHQVYPPGWNKPSTPGPVIYDFDAVSLDRHLVPGATRPTPAYGPVIYQFVPGGSHLHRIQ
jgi:hypothetical protein